MPSSARLARSFSGTVRQLIASQTKVRAYRWALERAGSLDECWRLTVEAMRDLGFDYVELVVAGGPRYESWLHEPGVHISRQNCWTVRIPLRPPLEESWMEISRHI